MSTQVVIKTIYGRTYVGINYRMDPAGLASPSTPNDPNGGAYHIQTANGWIDIPANEVASIKIQPGAPT